MIVPYKGYSYTCSLSFLHTKTILQHNLQVYKRVGNTGFNSKFVLQDGRLGVQILFNKMAVWEFKDSLTRWPSESSKIG